MSTQQYYHREEYCSIWKKTNGSADTTFLIVIAMPIQEIWACMQDGLLMHRLVCYTATILGYKIKVNKLIGSMWQVLILSLPLWYLHVVIKVFQFTVVGSNFTHLSLHMSSSMTIQFIFKKTPSFLLWSLGWSLMQILVLKLTEGWCKSFEAPNNPGSKIGSWHNSECATICLLHAVKLKDHSTFFKTTPV